MAGSGDRPRSEGPARRPADRGELQSSRAGSRGDVPGTAPQRSAERCELFWRLLASRVPEDCIMPGPRPAPKEQVLMTMKILGVLSAIFGALWLFETFLDR